jgi:hypothetical protein
MRAQARPGLQARRTWLQLCPTRNSLLVRRVGKALDPSNAQAVALASGCVAIRGMCMPRRCATETDHQDQQLEVCATAVRPQASYTVMIRCVAALLLPLTY